MRSDRSYRAHRSRGFTLIELMTALALSLMLMSGALVMAGVQLGEQRRLQLETLVQQELRATAELMLRDLRRAAFWDRSPQGVWRVDATALELNPYADLTVEDTGQRLSYSFARDASVPGGASVREASGFRLNEGRIDQLIAGRHQPVTDPALLRVRDFEVRVTSLRRDLADVCASGCGTGPCGPALMSRQVELVLDAEAAHDPRVRHRLAVRGLLRNVVLTGACG